MITRNCKVRTHATEVRFVVCFSPPDIKKFVLSFIEQSSNCNDPDLLLKVKSTAYTEQEIRYYLEHSFNCFAWLENKQYKVQLSAWAFAQMIQLNYIIPSAANENSFIFTEQAFTKVGRPKEN